MPAWDEQANKLFTPDEEQQLMLILQGKCPHNQGWSWASFGHNSDAYKCNLCGQIEWY